MANEYTRILRVGVTGHRSIPDESAIARAVDKVLGLIRETSPSADGAPPVIEVVSPIAEGADRIVVHAALKYPDTRLRVPLPFPKEDYEKDFETADSRDEFESLLERADDVLILPATPTRNGGYEKVGHYVLDNCDVLIAIWDGEPPRGQGGTAEIVAEARERGIPLFWVHTMEPGVTTEETETRTDL
jgi:hypothetical protein